MTFDPLASTVRNEHAAACAAFEQAWKAGERPRIEEYVRVLTPAERNALFQMLLETELELRREAGDQPKPGDYLERFEDYTELIRTAIWDTRPGEEIGAEPHATTNAAANFTPPVHLGTTFLAPQGEPHRPVDPRARPFRHGSARTR